MLSALSIIVVLVASATADSQATPQTGDSADKVVCKKQVDTGSLVRAKKICRTRAEWEKANTVAREEGQRMQNQGLIRPTNSLPGT
jgi:hypothetical protein